jgi:alkaline phosphatase D
MFWLGSEVAHDGVRPTVWTPYQHTKPYQERVDEVLAWFDKSEADRPRFAALYFDRVDTAGHYTGPRSDKTREALLEVDGYVGQLVDGLKSRGFLDTTNIIIVSDHGMTEIDSTRVVRLDEYVSLDDMEVVDWMPVAAITPAPGRLADVYRALQRVPHVQVFLKDSVPARYRYRAHPRITPIVLLADEGWTVSSTERLQRLGMPRLPSD